MRAKTGARYRQCKGTVVAGQACSKVAQPTGNRAIATPTRIDTQISSAMEIRLTNGGLRNSDLAISTSAILLCMSSGFALGRKYHLYML